MRNTDPEEYVGPKIKKVFEAISDNMFGNYEEMDILISSLTNRNDFYLVCHDFYSYCEAQEKVEIA